MMKMKEHRIVGNELYLLLFVWLLLTGLNLTKAFHIDDTFHLEAAEWISEHPESPMSGLINWSDQPRPMSSFNQPPLYFFLLSAAISVVGQSEISLHLFQSFFTFLSLFFFLKLLKQQKTENTIYMFVLLAFSPAFVVNQNLMVDMPLLSMLLGSVYFLLKAQEGRAINYMVSMLFLSAGLLTKYTLLPLLPVFAIVLIFRRAGPSLFYILIPIAVLGLWSLWNLLEYGSIHMLDRPVLEVNLQNSFLAFMVCIGGISTFTGSLLLGCFPYIVLKRIIIGLLLLLLLSVCFFLIGLIDEAIYSYYLDYLFFINAALVSGCLIVVFNNSFQSIGFKEFLKSDRFLFLLIIGGLAVFLIRFSPFAATRHILLILPFILLSIHSQVNKSKQFKKLTIIITISLGLLLGISDWKHSNYYKEIALSFDKPKDRTTWTAGHWGWQWYSKQRGMKQYAINEEEVKVGDYIVYPKDVDPTQINKGLSLKQIHKIWLEPNCTTFLYVSNFSSLYCSHFHSGPWRLSKRPLDTVFVFEVISKRPKQFK